MQVDSKPEELDELDRRIIQLKIEREAIKKEDDEPSKASASSKLEEGTRRSRRTIARLHRPRPGSQAKQPARRGHRRPRRNWTEARIERRTRPCASGKLEPRRANWQYDADPATWKGPGAPRRGATCKTRANPSMEEAVTDESRGPRGLALDRHSRRQDAAGRTREAARHGRLRSANRVVGQEEALVRSVSNGRQACTRRPAGRQTARSARSCSWAPRASARPN